MSTTTAAVAVPPAPATRRRRGLAPLEPVSASAKWLLGLGFFVAFFAVWAFATLGGYVSPTFLASPITMAQEGWLLFTEYNFIHDIGMTVWRVFGGFILAAIVAVPSSASAPVVSRSEALALLRPYIVAHMESGGAMHHITRHILGLAQGFKGARRFRQLLSADIHKAAEPLAVFDQAAELMEGR